jgi:protein-disulfide isomerase
LSDLGSAPLPPLSSADHVRGEGATPAIIEYADFECPFCAALHLRLKGRPLLMAFRHFPVRSSHPRAWAAACAAEAAGLQGRFWEMHDSLFADQGRLEDPHLWARAAALDLDLERFDSDRRGDAVGERIRGDFQAGVRVGVISTPTLFAGAQMYTGRIDPAVLDALGRGEEPAS